VALVGPAAGEETVKRLAPGKRVLHLATHGYFMSGGCPDSDGVSGAAGSLGLNSGLILAGANARGHRSHGTEDGVLTAEEIGGLDLRGVELVVLSACNSGQGDTAPAEGVFGLRRAFQAAGAGTLVMSLWPVADRSTREWMDAFYRQMWGSERAPAAATMRASQSVLEERRRSGRSVHPFYWGGFVSVGDPD
jgi:CHAT domain-containing protein